MAASKPSAKASGEVAASERTNRLWSGSAWESSTCIPRAAAAAPMASMTAGVRPSEKLGTASKRSVSRETCDNPSVQHGLPDQVDAQPVGDVEIAFRVEQVQVTALAEPDRPQLPLQAQRLRPTKRGGFQGFLRGQSELEAGEADHQAHVLGAGGARVEIGRDGDLAAGAGQLAGSP